MKLNITNIQPALEEKNNGKDREEFYNLFFVASVSVAEFEELKKKTEAWGIDVKI